MGVGLRPGAKAPDEPPTPYRLRASPRLYITATLVAAGADVSARDDDGTMPLHAAAASNRSLAVIATLLGVGADISARAGNGWTPLHAAARSNRNPAVVEALLAAGADVSARDDDGRTPWDLAQENERFQGTDAYWRLNDARFDTPR